MSRTPEENSKKINEIWEHAFGSQYGSWQGFLKTHRGSVEFRISDVDWNLIAEDRRNIREKNEAGRIVQTAPKITLPEMRSYPGTASLYFKNELVQIYNKPTWTIVKDNPKVQTQKIVLRMGVVSLNPKTDPESVKFWMLSPYSKNSPVWDPNSGITNGSQVSGPKFFMFDAGLEHKQRIIKEMALDECVAKIRTLKPETAELLAKELKCYPGSFATDDALGEIRYNLKKFAESHGAQAVESALQKISGGIIVVGQAIEAGILQRVDREWYMNGKKVWEEPAIFMGDEDRLKRLTDFVFNPENFRLANAMKEELEKSATRKKAEGTAGKKVEEPEAEPVKAESGRKKAPVGDDRIA